MEELNPKKGEPSKQKEDSTKESKSNSKVEKSQEEIQSIIEESNVSQIRNVVNENQIKFCFMKDML